MASEWRVLPPSPFATLTAAVDAGAERGLLEAARIGPAAVIDVILAAGLRGRGGAGFPTGRKWRNRRRQRRPRPPRRRSSSTRPRASREPSRTA